MRYKLERNTNNSTRYDSILSQLVGTYDSFDLAIDAIGDLELSDVHGELWLYAPGTSEAAMQADIEGYDMLAKIREISAETDL